MLPCPICDFDPDLGYNHAHECEFCRETVEYTRLIIEHSGKTFPQIKDNKLICDACLTYLSKREQYFSQTGQWA